MSISRSLRGASLALVALATYAQAQETPTASPVPPGPAYNQVISVSPLFALLGFYTADIERRVTEKATLGAGGSVFTLGPFGYRSVDLKARFYPAGRALEGLGVGASAGLIRLSADQGGLFSSPSAGSGIVVGTDATFTRLNGKRHNIAFSIGGGVKRVLRFAGYDVSAAQLTYPTARASIGLAF
jgi:hypothetical protein